MRRYLRLTALALAGFVAGYALPQAAVAQLGPHHHIPVHPYVGSSYYGSPYDFGLGAAFANMNDNAGELAQQRQLASQSRAMAQNYAVQSGIRSMLGQQARAQDQGLLDQRQSNQDWWFQVQQRQMAQQRALVASDAGAAVSPTSFEPAESKIIKWPAMLQAAIYAKQRWRVEGPFLREAEGRGRLTAKDYLDMIDAAAQMQQMLNEQAFSDSDLAPGEYGQADDFVVRLAKEAQARAEKLAAATRPAGTQPPKSPAPGGPKP